MRRILTAMVATAAIAPAIAMSSGVAAADTASLPTAGATDIALVQPVVLMGTTGLGTAMLLCSPVVFLTPVYGLCVA